MYNYSFPAWLLIFYIYCFSGWLFECFVVSIQQKKPINRGFLRGPMLPIYGFGATIMLFVALPLGKDPLKLFFAGMMVATAFEYVVGVIMEAIFKVKYWDYSSHRFQYQGRICLQSSLAWGLLSVALVYVLHPPIAYLLSQFNYLPLLFTVIVLSAYFMTDVVASVKTALDFAKLLEEVDVLRNRIGEMRMQLSEAAAETKDKLTEAAQGGRERLSDAAEQLSASAEGAKLHLYHAIQETEEQISQKIAGMNRLRKRLIRGNPTIRSARFSDALREIKERLNESPLPHRKKK